MRVYPSPFVARKRKTFFRRSLPEPIKYSYMGLENVCILPQFKIKLHHSYEGKYVQAHDISNLNTFESYISSASPGGWKRRVSTVVRGRKKGRKNIFYASLSQRIHFFFVRVRQGFRPERGESLEIGDVFSLRIRTGKFSSLSQLWDLWHATYTSWKTLDANAEWNVKKLGRCVCGQG